MASAFARLPYSDDQAFAMGVSTSSRCDASRRSGLGGCDVRATSTSLAQ